MRQQTKLACALVLAMGSSLNCTLLATVVGTSIAGTGAGGEGAVDAVFTEDMRDYEIESIAFDFEKEQPTSLCPGRSVSFDMVANAHKNKSPQDRVALKTRSAGSGAKARHSRIDFLEFAVAGRGGKVTRGSFTADHDPFAALLGYDLKASYTRDPEQATAVHFVPDYSCVKSVGRYGNSGELGNAGADGQYGGGVGGAGSLGGNGGPGPSVVAYVSIVKTPMFDRVGVVRINDELTLFDLETGILVFAIGGAGGSGGEGGPGGEGADPEGAGGPGGPGGSGGNGGAGGSAVVHLDHRYPVLRDVVKVSARGGDAGSGGFGGPGGYGGPAGEACESCDPREPGPDGPQGPEGGYGTSAGPDGRASIDLQNVSAVFASLPSGVALRDDPGPTQAPPRGGKKRRRRRR